MRNIFPEKSYEKCGRGAIPSPYSQKVQVEHIFGSIA